MIKTLMPKSYLKILALEINWLFSLLSNYYFSAILMSKLKKFLNLLTKPIVLSFYFKIIQLNEL